MEIELQKSYLELLDRIKAEARDNNTVVAEIITHFQPYFPLEKKNPIKKVLNNIFSNHNKSTPIDSIDHLLHRLEAKNVISKNDISSLSFIIDKLANTRLKSFYERHEGLILQITSNTPTVLPVKQKRLINKEVRDTVCHGISRRWKNLGRELGMTEEQIEQIEHKHKHEDFSVCASKVLDCFESKTEPAELEATLDQALIAAKRKDLADKIKPLMAKAKEQK